LALCACMLGWSPSQVLCAVIPSQGLTAMRQRLRDWKVPTAGGIETYACIGISGPFRCLGSCKRILCARRHYSSDLLHRRAPFAAGRRSARPPPYVAPVRPSPFPAAVQPARPDHLYCTSYVVRSVAGNDGLFRDKTRGRGDVHCAA
jgi:hypothetical protein